MRDNLTSSDTYFEDFEVGQRIKHRRGKTISPVENVVITNMVMNSAQGHFNEEAMKGTRYGKILQFGGITASLVIGLASQDTSDNAIKDESLTNVRFPSPVFHGDTIVAYSEVLEVQPAVNEGGGRVTFKHWGVNQRDEIVFTGTRTVLIKSRTKRS